MRLYTLWTISSFGSLALITMMFSASAQDVSPCKGKDQPACEAHEVFPGTKACKWVDGYTKADGTARKGYCRGSMKKAPADKQAAKVN